MKIIAQHITGVCIITAEKGSDGEFWVIAYAPDHSRVPLAGPISEELALNTAMFIANHLYGVQRL